MLPDGEVSVAWKRNKEGIEMKVSYPIGVQCEIEAENDYQLIEVQDKETRCIKTLQI